MMYEDAITIARHLYRRVSIACVTGDAPGGEVPKCMIAGGLRRQSNDVHDIELVSKPILRVPRPEFGQPAYKTEFDKILAQLEAEGILRLVMGGDKLKKYDVYTKAFGVAPTLNPFRVEFYQCTPPAQYGVLLMIRTGPAKDGDNFSKWIVTQRRQGGALPNGYQVKHGAVWREEQLDAKQEPIKGESPISMDEENDFFQFLELKWIDPEDRHAMWRRS